MGEGGKRKGVGGNVWRGRRGFKSNERKDKEKHGIYFSSAFYVIKIAHKERYCQDSANNAISDSKRGWIITLLLTV